MQSILSTGDTSRSAAACRSCKRKKIKCSGSNPCLSCQRHGLQCEFEGIVKRKNYPEVYVNELLEKVSEQAEQLKQYRNFILKQESQSDYPAALLSSNDHATKNGRNDPGSNSHDSDVQSTSSQASSTKLVDNVVRGAVFLANHGFASQVTQALEPRNPNPRKRRRRTPAQNKNQSNSIWFSQIPDNYELELPSEDRAYRLQDAVSRTLGDAYHFFDQREFADYVDSFYNSQDDEKELTSLGFAKFLLVMALGSLFLPQTQATEHPSGIWYFLKAKKLLPDISSLRHQPIIATEILCLIALYFQCGDQREDAYVYVGLAMRLALSVGMHTPDLNEEVPRSSITHRSRLWWSLYILDIRIAASIGAASGVPDPAIQIPIPSDYPGFTSPAALKANIFTAQTIGEIMCSLYNPERSSNDTIIIEVETVLNSLHRTREDIPPEYAIDFWKEIHISRTGATIYLNILQTMILAVRPILFHLLKRKILQIKGDSAPPVKCPQDVSRLTDICCCSAVKILRILIAMKSQNLLASFLPFDLDAAVSAAIVFLVEEVISATPQESTALKISGAFEVLRSMADTGSDVAKKRLKEIEHLHAAIQNAIKTFTPYNNREKSSQPSLIGPELSFLQRPTSVEEPLSTAAPYGQLETPNSLNVNTPDLQSVPMPYFAAATEMDVPAIPLTGTDRYFPLTLDPQLLSFGDVDLRGIYNDSDVTLTGVESSDWLELEKLAQDFPAAP